MRVVTKKLGSGWGWVVEADEKRGEFRSAENKGSLHARMDAPSAIHSLGRDDNALGRDDNAGGRDDRASLIPFMCAAADPQEKWWARLRGNPKRAGEISQAAFLLRAEMMGFHLALPWGDSERYDFVVWSRDGRQVFRVQVKGTGRLYRGAYEVQPVHSTRKGGKKRYTKKDIDVIAAHVQPEDVWYLIPIEEIGRAKSLRMCPAGRRKVRGRDWERWKGAWEVLGE